MLTVVGLYHVPHLSCCNTRQHGGCWSPTHRHDK